MLNSLNLMNSETTRFIAVFGLIAVVVIVSTEPEKISGFFKSIANVIRHFIKDNTDNTSKKDVSSNIGSSDNNTVKGGASNNGNYDGSSNCGSNSGNANNFGNNNNGDNYNGSNNCGNRANGNTYITHNYYYNSPPENK